MTVAPSFIVTFLVANSTPIVGPPVFGNEFFRYLESRHVLPTETSPIRMTRKVSVKTIDTFVEVLVSLFDHL